jgi:hypothetical protein
MALHLGAGKLQRMPALPTPPEVEVDPAQIPAEGDLFASTRLISRESTSR